MAIVRAGPAGLTAAHVLPFDTLIVAVGEKPEVERIRSATSEEFEIKTTDWGSIAADPRTLATSRKGLSAKPVSRFESQLRPLSLATSTTAVAPSARSPEGTHSLPCASKDFAESAQVVTEGVARREPGRCLRCDRDFDGDAGAKCPGS